MSGSQTDGKLKTYYCRDQGCASKAKGAFCNNQNLMDQNERPFEVCTGRPGVNKVCQHDGRLFATTYANADCEFEDEGSLIETSLCTDDDPLCDFMNAPASPPLPYNMDHGSTSAGAVATTSPPLQDNTHGSSIAIAVCAGVFILVILPILYFLWLKKKCNNQERRTSSHGTSCAIPDTGNSDDDTSVFNV